MGYRTGLAGTVAALAGVALAVAGTGTATTAGLVLVATGTYALVLPRFLQSQGVQAD